MSKNSVGERFMEAFLSPFWIFYYYLHSNYLRMGRGERYAISTAPAAVSSLFVLGPVMWCIRPIQIACRLIEEKNGYAGKDASELVFLIFLFISFMFMASYLSRKSHEIMKNFEGVNVPAIGGILVIVFLYCPPFLLPALMMQKWLVVSTLFVVVYQSIFYVAYFSKVMRSTEKGAFGR